MNVNLIGLMVSAPMLVYHLMRGNLGWAMFEAAMVALFLGGLLISSRR